MPEVHLMNLHNSNKTKHPFFRGSWSSRTVHTDEVLIHQGIISNTKQGWSHHAGAAQEGENAKGLSTNGNKTGR